MPSPSLSLSACFPLMSTIDAVRPAIFHRESFPTAVTSRLSGDCATAVAILASAAIRHSLALVMSSIGIMAAPRLDLERHARDQFHDAGVAGGADRATTVLVIYAPIRIQVQVGERSSGQRRNVARRVYTGELGVV